MSELHLNKSQKSKKKKKKKQHILIICKAGNRCGKTQNPETARMILPTRLFLSQWSKWKIGQRRRSQWAAENSDWDNEMECWGHAHLGRQLTHLTDRDSYPVATIRSPRFAYMSVVSSLRSTRVQLHFSQLFCVHNLDSSATNRHRDVWRCCRGSHILLIHWVYWSFKKRRRHSPLFATAALLEFVHMVIWMTVLSDLPSFSGAEIHYNYVLCYQDIIMSCTLCPYEPWAKGLIFRAVWQMSLICLCTHAETHTITHVRLLTFRNHGA